MNIVDMQRRSDALQRRYQILEHQRDCLAVLAEAYQNLWNQDEWQTRCTDLQRAISRDAVRNVQQIWDLSGPMHKPAEGVTSPAEEKEPDDLPF